MIPYCIQCREQVLIKGYSEKLVCPVCGYVREYEQPKGTVVIEIPGGLTLKGRH